MGSHSSSLFPFNHFFPVIFNPFFFLQKPPIYLPLFRLVLLEHRDTSNHRSATAPSRFRWRKKVGKTSKFRTRQEMQNADRWHPTILAMREASVAVYGQTRQ
jgi:hypothetical protein